MVRNLFHTILLICTLLVSSLYAQTTAIPDSAFEQALIDLGIDSDGLINGSVATSDVEVVTTLDISDKYIEFLTGIEDFINLTELYCQNNGIFNVNVNHNTQLKILNCSNQFYLTAPFTLNVSQNTALEYLNCSSNDLTSLNPSINPNLKTLICSKNQLRSLNVSQNTKLEYLNCSLNYYILPGGLIEFFSSLILGQNTNLTTINCSNNEISNLDITGVPSLTYLNCALNKLTSLNVYPNTYLEKLYCSNNQLTGLYLVNNTALTDVYCNGNQLNILTVKNGNNTALTTFNSQSNAPLTCIDIDDADAANANQAPYDNWLKDDTAIYLEDCQGYTVIPDPIFEGALIQFGIDTDGALNQLVLTADIATVTSLDIPYWQISDLTGIEDFISLTYLNCPDNKLTSLDVSQNTSLRTLYCHYNLLTTLDVSNNVNLTSLDCTSNQITSLDVSQNTNLGELYCETMQLTTLDVSKNLKLNDFGCTGNQLTSLDLSQNTSLVFVSCRNNLLENLNIKNGNNTSIWAFDATGNQLLTCIQVDDADAANSGIAPYDRWYKDVTASYSEDCSTLSLDAELFAQSISLYPNPVSNILTIDSEISLIKVEIYSVLGKRIKEVNSNFSDINIGNLSAGLYLTKIYSEKGITHRKIIKN